MSYRIVSVTDRRITLEGRLGFHEIQFAEGEIDSPAIVAFLKSFGVTLEQVRAFNREGNLHGSK